MNIYRTSFVAVCPNDGASIVYNLEISSPKTIFVEHINTATALIKRGLHEQIADDLHQQFGGWQKITAVHQGVSVISIRSVHPISAAGRECLCNLLHTTCNACRSQSG